MTPSHKQHTTQLSYLPPYLDADQVRALSAFKSTLASCAGRDPRFLHLDLQLRNMVATSIGGSFEEDAQDWQVTLIDWADVVVFTGGGAAGEAASVHEGGAEYGEKIIFRNVIVELAIVVPPVQVIPTASCTICIQVIAQFRLYFHR
jgi:hypothetical protein